MPQALILPIDTMQITADYKVQAYRDKYGFGHYGADCIDKNRQDRNVYGMGNGKVIACGMDGANSKDRLGNCIVIVYSDVECNDGTVRDLACRMFHFDKILCKAGDAITSSTIIGQYGSTGKYGDGAHLHIEFDTDINYPQYAVGIASSGKIIKRGTADTTVSPFSVFWLGKGQSVYAEQVDIVNGWVKSKSLALTETDDNAANSELQVRLQAVTAERDRYKAIINSIRKLLE